VTIKPGTSAMPSFQPAELISSHTTATKIVTIKPGTPAKPSFSLPS
jgi:hypothetical protein